MDKEIADPYIIGQVIVESIDILIKDTVMAEDADIKKILLNYYNEVDYRIKEYWKSNLARGRIRTCNTVVNSHLLCR